MKAFIIYENIASALRLIDSLKSVSHRTGVRVDWKINLWRANMLRFRLLANESLAEGADADLVVLTGAISLRPWLEEWLERWAMSRLIENAALALVQGKSSATHSAIKASELSEFARRHHLSFITSDREVEKAGTFTDQNVESPVFVAMDMLPS